MFDEQGARRIVEAVRRVEAQVKAMEMRFRLTYSGDNEVIIDGVANGDCAINTLGICTPNVPVGAGDVYFWNTLGDIDNGDNIIIGRCHRSSLLIARNNPSGPTTYVLLSDGCVPA